MQLPLELSARRATLSPQFEADLRGRVDKLERHYRRITSCRIHVEGPSNHHQEGGPWRVRLDITWYPIIDVKARGKVDVAQDLRAKGFGPADMTLAGTGAFDITAGLPSTGHYIAHAQWNTRVLWVHLGLIFDDAYDTGSWTAKR